MTLASLGLTWNARNRALGPSDLPLLTLSRLVLKSGPTRAAPRPDRIEFALATALGEAALPEWTMFGVTGLHADQQKAFWTGSARN